MRNVVVTGASRGLGLAITTRLLQSGYRVTAIARRSNAALEAATGAAGVSADRLRFLSADLSDIAAIQELARRIRSADEGLYGLVNNAGIGTAGVLGIMPERDMEALLRLNLLSPMTLTKYLLRPMMLGKSGRIISISSIVAETGYKGLSVYSATKSGLLGFTRSLAREVGGLGITVNAVLPGFIETEMTHGIDPNSFQKIKARSALQHLASAQDVAGAVSFLLGDDARSITGRSLVVDAGATI